MLFSYSYIIDGNYHQHIKTEENEYFLQKMKEFDTYYISRIINGSSTSLLLTAAIIEVGTMNLRTHKYEKKDDGNGNIVYDSKVTGYKPKSKFIILHNIATVYDNRGRGYAKALLEGIAKHFFGKNVYMYWFKKDKEEGFFLRKNIHRKNF